MNFFRVISNNQFDRILLILVSFFILQSNAIAVTSSPIIFGQGYHIGISETYTYVASESSACIEAGRTGGISRVLSVKGVRPCYEVLIDVARVVAKGEGRVFWSGGDEAMNAAANYAKANGGKTLEMTLGVRVMITLNPVLPRFISSPIWKSLSTNFARGATGSVNVFHNVNGVRLQSVWAQTEYGILRGNNVNIFYYNVFP